MKDADPDIPIRSPRLVVDGGIDVGLSTSAPQKRLFMGATYSIANLDSALKQHGRAKQNGKPSSR